MYLFSLLKLKLIFTIYYCYFIISYNLDMNQLIYQPRSPLMTSELTSAMNFNSNIS